MTLGAFLAGFWSALALFLFAVGVFHNPSNNPDSERIDR